MKVTLAKKIIAVLAGLAMFLIAIPAFGQQGQGQMNQKRGGQGKAERMQKMAQMLNLSSSQQALFQKMNDAKQANREINREIRRHMRQMMKEQMQSENPNFSAVASAVKSKFSQEAISAFNAMVDASMAFHQSLTPEQREMMKQRKQGGKGQRGGHGHGNFQGGGPGNNRQF